jgi:activator of HSP90 ATPase
MTPFIVLTQRLYSVRSAKLYNKKEIVSITEEYSIPGNVVTQPGECMDKPVGLFHIMLKMDMSQRYKQAIRHHTCIKVG